MAPAELTPLRAVFAVRDLGDQRLCGGMMRTSDDVSRVRISWLSLWRKVEVRIDCGKSALVKFDGFKLTYSSVAQRYYR